MRKRLAVLCLVVALVAAVSACRAGGSGGSGGGSGSGGGDGGEVTLMLPFQKSLSFWPELLGDKLGYFSDEGVKVRIETSGGGTEALQQLLTGNVDVAMVAPAVIINAVAEGKNLAVPYTDKNAGLFSIAVPEGSGISSPADLRGRTVGITDFGGGEVPIVKAILGRAGLEQDRDVKLVAVGEGNPAVVRALETGRIDAYGASWSDFIPMMGLGMKLKEVTYPDIQKLPSEVMVVRPDWLQANRDTVTKVARAMAKASYFVTQFHDKSLGLLKQVAPQDFPDTELARLSLDIWLKIAAYPKQGEDYTFGRSDPATWETLEKILRDQGGGLATDVDTSRIVDNNLIDQINDFSRDEVKKQGEDLSVTFP